jgi:hypothetical protein
VNSRRSKIVKVHPAASAFLAALLLVSGGAYAKDRKASDDQAHVVGHSSFAGMSSFDMAMQKKVNNKYYLYVQHSKDQGISIIDVSKPAQAKTIGDIPWPDPAVSSRMNLTGDLAIVAESEVLPMRGSASADDLVLWDLSNPTAPRVVQKFSGVVKWLQDERNFIYVLNGEGLWIVSKPADRQSEQTESSNSY